MADNASAGATPAAAGATPTQTTPVSPAAEPVTPPDDSLGDGGKRALEAERKTARDALKRAADAEKALEDLKLAGASDSEKAIAKAKADGAAEVTGRFHDQIRRSEVKLALSAAGINPSVLDLAAKADEFVGLKVTDTGQVEGLDQAIAQFKGTRGDLFKPAVPTGSSGLGTGSADRTAGAKSFTREQLRDPAFFAANRDDILEAQKAGRITG